MLAQPKHIFLNCPLIHVTSQNQCNSYPSQPHFRGEKSRKYGCFVWLLRWRPSWSSNTAVVWTWINEWMMTQIAFLFSILHHNTIMFTYMIGICHLKLLYFTSKALWVLPPVCPTTGHPVEYNAGFFAIKNPRRPRHTSAQASNCACASDNSSRFSWLVGSTALCFSVWRTRIT